MVNNSQLGIKSIKAKWILLAAILASGMAFLITSAVSVALPTIQSYFQANISGIQWVVNSYALALAMLILTSGSLGDRFGRKKVFIIGIVGFILASLLSGLARTINQLIAFQALQGIGAAMMIPGSLSIINVSIKEDNRGQAIGYWAGISGGVAAVGPFLGGWLIQNYGWSSIFFINVPIGLIALFTTIKFVPESYNPDFKTFDWLGTSVISFGLFSLSYGLIRVPISGWDDTIVLASIAFGLLAIILFVWVEKMVDQPLVPLRIFSNPLVAGANILTFTLYFALYATIFFLVLNLQQVQGYTPIMAGLGLLPPIILIAFFSGIAGSLADRIGPRLQMIFGPLIVSTGMFFLIIPGDEANYFTQFMPGLILFGLGMAIVISPLTKSALTVKKEFSGAASGVNNAISRIAALMAIAIIGAVSISIFKSNLELKIPATSLSKTEQVLITRQVDKFGGIEIPSEFNAQSKRIASKLIKESFITSFRWAMAINASMAFISFLFSYFFINNPNNK